MAEMKTSGVIAQHSYGETEDSPAVGYECVLPPAGRLKEILIRLMQPSVDLDRQRLPLEGDVDIEQLTTYQHWGVGLLALDVRRT
jgi:hypothetical protein